MYRAITEGKKLVTLNNFYNKSNHKFIIIKQKVRMKILFFFYIASRSGEK